MNEIKSRNFLTQMEASEKMGFSGHSEITIDLNNVPAKIAELAHQLATAELEALRKSVVLNSATETMMKAREELSSAVEELEMRKLALHDACEKHVKNQEKENQ